MNIELETERLIFKIIKTSDFENLLALRSDSAVMQYIGDGSVQTRDQVSQFLEMALDYHKKTGLGFFSVFEKESQKFIGQAGLFHVNFDVRQNDIEIAYRFHQKYWKKGYATESAKGLVAWGFQNLSVKKLIGLAHPNNINSQKVLQKAGLWYEGIKKYYNQDILCYVIYEEDKIELAPYDPEWINLAAKEIKLLQETFSSDILVDIQHVGSTAIPGMVAKPIIDIQMAVHSLTDIKAIAIEKLEILGYEFWHDNPDASRLFFMKGRSPFGEKRTHHVHIVEADSRHWHEKIIFRDYLIAHSPIAEEYLHLKQQLAKLYQYDREQYTEAKTNFIKKILQLANTK